MQLPRRLLLGVRERRGVFLQPAPQEGGAGAGDGGEGLGWFLSPTVTRLPGMSGVLGFSFACGRRPDANLNRRTERGHRTVAANMTIWSVDSDMGCLPDRALLKKVKTTNRGRSPLRIVKFTPFNKSKNSTSQRFTNSINQKMKNKTNNQQLNDRQISGIERCTNSKK